MTVIQFAWLISKSYHKYLLIMIIAMVGVALHTNFQSYFLKLLIDAVSSKASDKVITVSFFFGAVQILIVLSCLIFDIANAKAVPMRLDISNFMIKKIRQYDVIFFQDNLSGSVLSQINRVSNLIPNMIYVVIEFYIKFIIVIIIALFLLAKVNSFFSLVIIAFTVLFALVFYSSLAKIKNMSASAAESDAKVWGRLADYLSNILTVKYFASYNYEANHLESYQQEFNKKRKEFGYFLAFLYMRLGILFVSYIVACMVTLIYLYNRNLITIGDFAFIFAINYKIIDQLFSIIQVLRDFIENWGTVEQGLELLNIPVKVQDKKNAVPIEITTGKIVFDKVSFNYKKTANLFCNKSIIIEPGQKIGLVGHSGGGKTSFINLILRLHDVNKGKILIDNQDISSCSQDSLRSQIAIIPQDQYLFHRSLMENIRYGRLNAKDEEVIEAAKQAYAHEFIIKTTEGYHSLVGERGVKLSGGQRQRIAIARAILKNAPILILDEATSQLDSITEHYIQESMRNLMQNKTTIAIAHRLSTLLTMDRILVFEQGKIIGDGTHKELLEKNSLYKTLWDAQSNGFLP